MTAASSAPVVAIPPGSWLGLLGGGQLGRMFCMAAQSLGYRVAVVDPGEDSPAGSIWAVATEVHLVNRLAHEVAPERTVVTLDPFGCLCSTMFRVSPNHLLWILEGLVNGEVHNQIIVPEDQKRDAKLALDRMLEIKN